MMSSDASAAIIAPLSVQSDSGRNPHGDARGIRSLERHVAQARVGDDAAAEQQARHAVVAARGERLRHEHVDDGLAEAIAATSATGTGSPAASRCSTQRATAVFSPENEKS